MKKALKTYFDKQKRYYADVCNSAPIAVYSEKLNQDLLTSSVDKDGYVEWLPKKQTATINWEIIENKLGFALAPELKEYYSAYSFLHADGKINDIFLNFYSVNGKKSVIDSINQHRYDAEYYFPNSQAFLIGDATIDDDDGYFIFYDNEHQQLFCFEDDTNRKVVLDHTFAKTIELMEPTI